MTASPAKVYVYPVKGHSNEVAALQGMIRAAGCVVVCQGRPVETYEQCVRAADVLVILICPEAAADPSVAQAVELANKLGKRVVGVWPNAPQYKQLPPWLESVGNATVTLEAEQIAAAVCGGESIWSNPDGEPRPKPKTPRHKG